MNVKDILKIYGIEGFTSAKTFGSGNINETYKVVAGDKSFLVQKMNGNALPDIYGALGNIECVTKHLLRKGENSLELLITKTNENHFIDGDGFVWRVYPFIENSYSVDVTDNCQVIEQIAFAFGRFDSLLRDLNPRKLSISDPYFHDTIQKYHDLEESISKDIKGRVKKANDTIAWCRGLISKALAIGVDLFAVSKAKKNGELPIRVVHNDTKLNNVLLSKETNKYLAVVDLDTCMPGTILNDFGDGVRSNANATTETEENLDRVRVDMKKFEAFTEGFLKGFGSINLDKLEQELLATSCLSITFELGTRFLKDYLDGDVFFKIISSNENFNLHRAKVQFKLLEDMIDKYKEMQYVIGEKLRLM